MMHGSLRHRRTDGALDRLLWFERPELDRDTDGGSERPDVVARPTADRDVDGAFERLAEERVDDGAFDRLTDERSCDDGRGALPIERPDEDEDDDGGRLTAVAVERASRGERVPGTDSRVGCGSRVVARREAGGACGCSRMREPIDERADGEVLVGGGVDADSVRRVA
jgi:hypothetical protein